MTVQDVMTAPARSCSPKDSLHTAAEIMWQGDCGCVPVTDENKQLIGMITDRDICMSVHMDGHRLRESTVETTMSKGPCACLPEDSLEDVAALMADKQLRRLPVVDSQGRVIGVVSLNDLALAANDGSRKRGQGISLGTVAATLAAISKHRPTPGSAEPR